jgi:two-component system, OmpR family, response regulator ChvI
MTAPSKPVVAIVDDDLRILEALEELLGSSGYAVCLFPSATELLKSHSLSDFDCLICDICMPGMRGTEVQRLVDREVPELPMILISGRYELNEQLTLGRNNRRFFRKPFNCKDLLAAVNTAVRSLHRDRGIK